jgi:uncharacterized protein
MAAEDFRVPCDAGTPDGAVSARLYHAEGRGATAWLILAPGAGAGHDHAFMVAFSTALAARGLNVVTFNFPYVERGRRVPDRNPVLEAAWAAVLLHVRARAGADAALVAGGKSMGGRIASQVAARDTVPGAPCGLVFLGYPLHPPGRSEQRRTAHWPRVTVPALFVQGSRDPFASPDELAADLPSFGGRTSLEIVEGGDHSFKVPGGASLQREVLARIQESVAGWVATTVSRRLS